MNRSPRGRILSNKSQDKLYILLPLATDLVIAASTATENFEDWKIIATLKGSGVEPDGNGMEPLYDVSFSFARLFTPVMAAPTDLSAAVQIEPWGWDSLFICGHC